MSPLDASAVEVGASLLATSTAAGRAAIVASAIVDMIPDSACAIHRLVSADDNVVWATLGTAGEISLEQSGLQEGNLQIFSQFSESQSPLIYPASSLRREDYSHLNVTRSVASIAYLPLLSEDSLMGAVEILTFSNVIETRQLEEAAPIVAMAATAILSAEESEQHAESLLDSVHRMSQLYDLEKSLHANLEMDTVIQLIPEKALAMLACQAVHLWLFDGGTLRLVSSSGADATVELGMAQAPGEGYVADMGEEGEALLIDDPNDERLILRNSSVDGDDSLAPVTNVMLAPLVQDEAEVGVLEAVNKDGGPFDEDDLFFLTSMAETVSSALKNASLMHAEQKLEILKALVSVSSEISSTLRLDRLLQIAVNSPQNVLPYQLCAMALDHHGRLQLKAISGMPSMPLGDALVERLRELVHWLSSQTDTFYFKQKEEPGPEANPDLPPAVVRHFEETGYRGLYSVPLTDDQGRVGVLLYESTDPDFLETSHTEMIKILSAQMTVAVRNALLYRELPLISLLEPLVQKKDALLNTTFSRRVTMAAVLAAVALFLIFCPLPMRVVGDAVVAPQRLVTIAAPVDGNVEAVLAHEGQRVAAGEVLGTLNDWQWRTDLAASEAKYQEAMLVMENDLAHTTAQAGADRAQAEYLNAEVERARSRVESAQLRSPIAGIVVTPNLRNLAGQHLDAGATFAQVLDLNSAEFQIAVPERDAPLLHSGQDAAIKLDSYPQRTWRNRVSVVNPEAQAGDGVRTFTAVVPVQNSDATLRAGMSGRAKIFIGWRPAGYVLLRRPALWIWQTLWNWIGW